MMQEQKAAVFCYPEESSYPTHPVLKPKYPPAIMTNNIAQTFAVVTIPWATVLCGERNTKMNGLSKVLKKKPEYQPMKLYLFDSSTQQPSSNED